MKSQNMHGTCTQDASFLKKISWSITITPFFSVSIYLGSDQNCFHPFFLSKGSPELPTWALFLCNKKSCRERVIPVWWIKAIFNQSDLLRFFFFFGCGPPFLKSLLNFLQFYFHFRFRFFGPEACGIYKVLTTGSPGKSNQPIWFKTQMQLRCFCPWKNTTVMTAWLFGKYYFIIQCTLYGP